MSVENAGELERAMQLVDEYPELSWMVGEGMHATPERSADSAGATVGQQLFPDADKSELIEFNRTFVGVRAMDWMLDGDHAAFTACQPEPARLTPQTFNELGEHARGILSDEQARKAMETFVVTNDLGKIGEFVDAVREMPDAPDTVDHDVLMLHGLSRNPDLSPSFAALSPEYQRMILDGLGTEFNLGQFMQAEGVPASLSGLTGVDKDSRDFYLLHTLFDLAGAVGQSVQNGSVTVTESTARNYEYALEALDGLENGKTVDEVYTDYVAKKAEEFGIDLDTDSDFAVTRLATMLRMSTPEQAEKVRAVYNSLPPNTRTILDTELNMSGTDDGVASLIYYSPALLANLQKKAGGDTSAWDEAMQTGFTTLARVYQQARARKVVRDTPNGVQTVLISDLAAAAAADPDSLNNSKFVLDGNGLDVTAHLQAVPEIDIDSFPHLGSLADLPGDRFALIGMGGGSDGVQAAMMARLLQEAGKDCPAVVSVRGAKPQSQAADGSTPVARTVENHGGEFAGGVFRITSDTRGSGRFLEHLPAADVPMYLVTDFGGVEITDQLEAVLRQVGGVDTVIGLDTGGDVLYGVGIEQEVAQATPDQDVRILEAIKRLHGVGKFACVVAPGIDTPDNAETVLHEVGATYWEPDAEQVEQILDTYTDWGLDGSHPEYFGKTPLAWQAALRADDPHGVAELDLPQSAVTSKSNPWVPYVNLQPGMRGAFVFPIKD